VRYYPLRIVGLIVGLLPVRVGYLIARLVAYAFYLLSAVRRRSVRNNIDHVIGAEADKDKVRRTVRAVFRNAARNYVDLVHIPRLKVNELEKNAAIHGWQYFEAALNQGKGVIIATCHLGSFELVAQLMVARSIKSIILVEPMHPERLFRYVSGLRASQGLTLMSADAVGLRESICALRRGEVVVVVCDRDIQGNGLRVKFFGEETTLPGGAVALALRTGATVIPVFGIRGTNGRFDVHIEAPLSLVDKGNRQICTQKNLENLTGIIEKYIRQYPEQWVVLEPIWGNNHAANSNLARLPRSGHRQNSDSIA
jgi:lauroyl/myristoyl acyltransferase